MKLLTEFLGEKNLIRKALKPVDAILNFSQNNFIPLGNLSEFKGFVSKVEYCVKTKVIEFQICIQKVKSLIITFNEFGAQGYLLNCLQFYTIRINIYNL